MYVWNRPECASNQHDTWWNIWLKCISVTASSIVKLWKSLWSQNSVVQDTNFLMPHTVHMFIVLHFISQTQYMPTPLDHILIKSNIGKRSYFQHWKNGVFPTKIQHQCCVSDVYQHYRTNIGRMVCFKLNPTLQICHSINSSIKTMEFFILKNIFIILIPGIH